jgi:ATP-dependent DNA helicase RecQ
MSSPEEILNSYWGYNSFRPLQEEIINSVLEKRDTLALMPTGGGKSLCYQIPAMCKDGLCLVISPLIALMKDQVENLRKKGITAFSIYSGMSRKEVMNTLKVAGNSNCKFLYVSPERLETNLFKEFLPSLDINLIAVDEAHCISQWGYDFRPPYLRIAVLREELAGIPILALTATATPDVQIDICDKLTSPPPPLQSRGELAHNWKVFRQSFERPNLSFSVFNVESRANKIIEIISNVQGSGIVYCKSRKRTKEIADLLSLQNISSDYYHAGLLPELRSKKQEAWIKNKTRIIVCTNAFGMGIDKPDVRVVVHADMPDSLENYYQEAGRAGRDLQKSFAVLLYDDGDIAELEAMPDIRFPTLENIRSVYQSVCNYLQLPAGSNEGIYYDFDIGDFIKKFKLNIHTVVYSLKTLEQDGWLSFNEQVFLPSIIQFNISKNDLYDFEKNNPTLEPLIKSLLRAYEGIFDFPTSISEMILANLNKTNVDIIKVQLQQLNASGILEYRPQKDSPQVFLLKNRVKAEDLVIDLAAFKKRKEKYIQRIKMMMQYAHESIFCRSQLFGNYFGDTEIKKCGVCDNCLRQKALVINKVDFKLISDLIYSLLSAQPLPTKDLLLEMSGVKKEKAWKVIDLLHAENKIEIDTSGWVRLK